MAVAWFSRRGGPRFPSDALARLELYGRFEMDPQGCGVEASHVWEHCMRPFVLDSGSSDRDAILVALHAVVAGDRSGFATYGASCLAWELCTGDILEIPAALPLIDAGIAFKLDRGLSHVHLKGYEMERLCVLEGRDRYTPRLEGLNVERPRIDP